MKVQVCVSHPDDELEKHRPKNNDCSWELVISGYWSQSPYQGGHVAYFIANTEDGWLLDRVERNACLDGVTEEDVAEGSLNDDQRQAMWGITLEEAQNQVYRRIVAVCEDAKEDADSKKMAELLYDAVCKESGKVVEEVDEYGLLDF